jgi:N6-L-threonylcarbamoyladenine synthase
MNRSLKNISKNIFKKRYSTDSLKKTVLGIETSCDDTGVAIVNSDRELLAESKYNQWSIHKKLGHARSSKSSTSWPGGVIPDLARKLHRDNLILAVHDCIEMMPNKWQCIDSIALTVKPGLEPCLWEGLNLINCMMFPFIDLYLEIFLGIKFTILLLKKYKVNLIPIHHMESHALMGRMFDQSVKYPFLTLLISGGHCLLSLVESPEKFLRFGESVDISPGFC